jgi:hypothetical protein
MIGLLVLTLIAALLLVMVLILSVPLQFPSLVTAHAATINDSIKMTKQESFIDSNGRLNIIGVVDNNSYFSFSLQYYSYSLLLSMK